MMKSSHLRLVSLVLALAWMATIFYLSSRSDLKLPTDFVGSDKLAHAVAYGWLGILLLGAMRLAPKGYRWQQVLLATMIAGLYGLSDEWHQSFVPVRHTDLWDAVADFTGALIATTVLALLVRRYVSRPAPAT